MRYLNLILITTFFMSCSDGKKNEAETASVKSTKKEVSQPAKSKEREAKSINLITNKNVEDRLMSFGLRNPESLLLIKTSKGDLKVRLYKDTPLHRANFVLMAKNDCFDSTVFTRVAENFMAQAGGTYSQKMVDKRNSIGRYTIPQEILPKYFHKKGALGAARSYNNNPDKRSSAFAFYFVEGSTYNDLTLDKYEELNGYTYSSDRRNYYLNNPGAAHIDGEHTIFGEVIEGFDIIPDLTHVETDSRDWPKKDIYIIDIEIIE